LYGYRFLLSDVTSFFLSLLKTAGILLPYTWVFVEFYRIKIAVITFKVDFVLSEYIPNMFVWCIGF